MCLTGRRNTSRSPAAARKGRRHPVGLGAPSLLHPRPPKVTCVYDDLSEERRNYLANSQPEIVSASRLISLSRCDRTNKVANVYSQKKRKKKDKITYSTFLFGFR